MKVLKNAYRNGSPWRNFQHISGNIYNDDRFAEGTLVHTSPIQKMTHNEDHSILVTENNTYRVEWKKDEPAS